MKLSIAKIACALELPEGKVERWIRQGRIPLSLREDVCTFDRQTLERWATQHNLVFNPEGRHQEECRIPGETRLATALQTGGVYYDIKGGSATEVFAAVVDRMTFIPQTDKMPLIRKLEERETLASTGIGKGIAIPHPREPESLGLQAPSVSACFLAAPIDFGAVDGRPVSILFVLLSPTVRTHLQILSKLSYCLRQDAFITYLQRPPEPEDLIARLDRMESSNTDTHQRPR